MRTLHAHLFRIYACSTPLLTDFRTLRYRICLHYQVNVGPAIRLWIMDAFYSHGAAHGALVLSAKVLFKNCQKHCQLSGTLIATEASVQQMQFVTIHSFLLCAVAQNQPVGRGSISSASAPLQWERLNTQCAACECEQAVQTGAKSCVVRVWMLCEWQRGEEERWKAGFGRKTHCLPATPIVQHLRSPVSPCLASVCRCCMRPETLGLPFMALCVKLRD
jgi:hypothetical protein